MLGAPHFLARLVRRREVVNQGSQTIEVKNLT